MLNIFIRTVVHGDAEKLLKYIPEVLDESDYLTYGADECELDIDSISKLIEESLNSKNIYMAVATVDDEIVGYLKFSSEKRTRLAHGGEFGITVKRTFWGHGIGTQLIKNMLEWAKNSNSIRKINLRVHADNNHAKALYDKMGFVEEGILRRAFLIKGVFYDAINMGILID